MRNAILRGVTLIAAAFWISACASQRPVLATNEHLIRVGAEAAKRDVDECIDRAKATSTESGGSSTGNVVAGKWAYSACFARYLSDQQHFEYRFPVAIRLGQDLAIVQQ
jgi:hypothetical protein